MTGPGGPGDGTSSIESLRELQLRALLNDLVKDMGPVGAAERLGVDRKTLWRSEGAGQMTPRLVEALERMLLERALTAMEEVRAEVRALEQRLAELEGQLQQVLACVSDGERGRDADGLAVAVETLREEYADGLQRLERRVEGLESTRGGDQVPSGSARTVRGLSLRRHNGVVIREPADEDEEVYGAVYPLVSEWRALWVGHSPRGKGLAWALKRERILELELAMLEEHGLTLPPETAPLVGPERREQLSWRKRELARVRTRRARLQVLSRARRLLTLGLWRRQATCSGAEGKQEA